MNNPIEGLEGLPDEQKNALMTQIEEMQVRDRYVSRQTDFSLQQEYEKGFCLQSADVQQCGGAVLPGLCRVLQKERPGQRRRKGAQSSQMSGMQTLLQYWVSSNSQLLQSHSLCAIAVRHKVL